jgi:3-keto-disaccharide hydrolase
MMFRRLALSIVALSVIASALRSEAQVGGIPAGLTPIFNGKNTDGWHWSRTVHHGTNAIAKAEDGALVLQPHPYGQGGLLLTDKTYKDFEFYVEVKPDPNYNSGLFLRSSEGGSAYQIELVVPGNATGRLLGEGLRLTSPQYIGPQRDVTTVWKDGDWNSMHVRMVGEAPHLTMWINGQQMWEVQMPKNDQLAGLYGGMIGLQLHWSATYTEAAGGGGSGMPWAVQRFRNMAIKEIK